MDSFLIVVFIHAARLVFLEAEFKSKRPFLDKATICGMRLSAEAKTHPSSLP